MSDISNIVLPMSYSVQGAMDNMNMNQSVADETGWKSSPDNSEKTTIIQIRLDNERLFNRISFDLLDVPQQFSVFYWDKNRKQAIRIQTFTGYLNGTVNGSKSGLETQAIWKTFSFAFPFISSNLIEIHINRSHDGLRALNLSTNTRYSLGVRNVNIRFHRVNEEINSTNEIDGYSVNYFSSASVLDDSSYYWKSPPLGPNSLYSFYVDLRKENGQPQTVEFMKLIPLYTGSHVNIYKSDDESFGIFNVSNNEKTFSFNINDSSVPTDISDNWSETKGLLLRSTNSWSILNKDIKVNLNFPFTIGFTYEAVDFSNLTKHYFWNLVDDSNYLSCYFEPTSIDQTNDKKIIGNLIVELNGEQPISIEDVELQENTAYAIVVGYDTQSFNWILNICPMNKRDINKVFAQSSIEHFKPNNFILGFNSINEDEPDSASKGYIKNVWIRQDTYQDSYVNTFIRNSETFIRGLGDLKQRNNGYYNAVLVAELTQDLIAKVGPNSAYYETKLWSPANKNFILNSSIYNLGRLNAKFLKLEFSKPTVQYYNPATSEEVKLPIFDFPDWVKDWYVNHRFDNTVPPLQTNNYIFEARNNIKNYSGAYGLNSVKSAIESSNNNLIYNIDQVGTDFFLAPSTDEEALRNQIALNVFTLQFPTICRHDYKTYDYTMTSKRAFFYGMVELSFFSLDPTVEKDNKIYSGDFIDGDIEQTNWIESYSDFFVTEDKVAMSSVAGCQLVSKDFISFSDFSSVQIGYLESPFKDLLSSSQINLVDTSHLSRTDSEPVKVINNLIGSTDGKTVVLDRVNEGYYGLRTSNISLPSALQTHLSSLTPGTEQRIRLVAGCRVRSSNKTSLAHYELRILSNNKVVARKVLDLPDNYGWAEFDLIYLANPGEAEFKVEIMMLDSFSDEYLYVDMLGLWMERNKWEISIRQSVDDEIVWVPVTTNVNNPFGIVSAEAPGKILKLRITSLDPSSWISEWMILPIYDYAPVGMSSLRLFDFYDPNDPEYRSTLNQKFFSSYPTSIPRNYSIINDVIGSKNRLGM